MRAKYNRKTKYVTVSDERGEFLIQKCRNVSEAKKIARQYGAEMEVEQ